MPYITEIEADGELNPALAQFNTICIANAVVLALSPGNLTEIAGAATGFNSTFNALTAAKAAATSAKEAKDTQKGTSKGIISKWAKVFRANIAVPDALLGSLMLPPHSTPGQETMPAIPTELVANSNGEGFVTLRWNRAGNIQGTTFIVEFRLSAADPWTILGTTTKKSFGWQASPGVYIAFRVSAKRRGVTSPASTPVVLWDTEQGMQLQIAA